MRRFNRHLCKRKLKHDDLREWIFVILILFVPLHRKNQDGAIAQLVEQRTENPCVPGSIPGGTTPPFMSPVRFNTAGFFFYGISAPYYIFKFHILRTP